MYTRREFGALAAGGFVLSTTSLGAQRSSAPVRGVKLGAITGVYGPFTATPPHDVTDVVIQRSLAAGIEHVELVNSLYEPRVTGGGVGGQVPQQITPEYTVSREALRQWRLTTPLSTFEQIRRKFDQAGLNLYSYVMTIGDDFTDAEIDAVFRQMAALRADRFCTNQTRLSVGPRMAPFAEKYKIRPAFHNHAAVHDANEVASVESFQKLFAMSPMFMANLDIGHFTRGGNDPLAFLKANHRRITHLHVRDAKADGTAANIGEGDIKIAEMLHFVRDNRYDVGFILEQRRQGVEDGVDAAKANLAYLRRALET